MPDLFTSQLPNVLQINSVKYLTQSAYLITDKLLNLPKMNIVK